jgi:hypothetical protein
MEATGHDETGGPLRAYAYTVAWRILLGALVALAGVSLPAILTLVLLATDPPVTPPLLARLLLVFPLPPALAAWLLRRRAVAVVEGHADALVIRTASLQLEIPAAAVERVVPWVMPLPGPGLWLQMRSGRRLTHGLEAADLPALLAAFTRAGAGNAARAAATHPSVVYARARRAAGRRRWDQVLGKFVVFALVPTLPLFNVHQHIAYGGPLGEYYLLGLASYLATFAIYWGTTIVYLVLYASVWRGAGEAVALVAAHAVPARAAAVRRLVEVGCGLGYYGGVPVGLLLRFLPW